MQLLNSSRSLVKAVPAFAVTLLHISVASAQVSTSDEEVEFAGPEICKPGLINIPLELRNAPGGNQDNLPTNIEADEIEAVTDSIVLLKGNAQIVQGSRGVYADEIQYDQATYQATADGNAVFYTPNGDEIRADSVELEVDTFIGDAQNVRVKVADPNPYYNDRAHEDFIEDYSVFAPFSESIFLDPDDSYVDDSTYVRARAEAETMDFEGADFERLHNVNLTSCAEGNNDVLLSAKQIELDHASGIGTAKNMTLRFKKVPIFYFPHATFPITNDRKTGFLFPAAGYEDESGWILETPYYINIAPQYDATLIPRILSERGLQVFGEFRYLGKDSRGAIRGEYLPSDRNFDDEDRYALGFDHDQDFGDDWEASVDAATVSDSDYLRDFSNDVDIVASSYVTQRADLNYFGDLLRFDANVKAYDTVNDDIDASGRPYETLPQFSLDLRPQEFSVFEGGIDSEFSNFQHDDSTRVEGTRARVIPYLSMPLEEIYGFITPKVSVNAISYSLDNAEPGNSDSPSATIPVFSLDSGLFFDRSYERSDTPYTQTLEPRVFYLNVPEEEEQNEFPDFDTGEGSDSSFSHFFRENRFFGGDRVGDTEQVTLGLTSRIINDDSGRERLKLSIGQVFYFADRVIGLDPDDAPDTDDESDFLAEITTLITEDWDLTGFGRWDNQDSELDYVRLSLDYDHSSRRNAYFSYTYDRDLSQQLNFDFETPMGPLWQFEADAAYSIEDEELRSSGISLAYDGCCWATRIGAQRYLDGTGIYRNRYLFTMEFDDLGRISSGL